MEEAGREVGRLRDAVEGAVVGEHVHVDGEDLAVLRRRDLRLHVVVAGERRRHEVLAAVLHPLHRLAGDDGADDREDVAGVDADLVAEAAADIGADDADLVLRQARHHRVDRAVGVGRLARRVHRELAGDLVEVRDRAAGLHRRRVHARVEDVLLDDDAVRIGRGGGERCLRGLLVARLPRLVAVHVGDAVVGLALVVADDGGVGVERLLRIHHRRQRVVVDVDELERVLRDVPALGDDVGDLLALEAHLVGGQDGLGVVRQRRHPREVVTEQRRPRDALEGLAGDDGNDARQRLGSRRVDRVDAGVREGAAQDGAVQHAGQVDVIDVVALAPHEALVLHALHRAEPDGVAGCADRNVLDGGHAFTSLVAGLSAAHWMDATMFL